MGVELQPRSRFHWSHLLTVGLGVFAGCFWMVYGLLLRLGTPAPWWQYAAVLAPGAAVLLLVLLARRQPLPYGTGLVALGLATLLVSGLQFLSLIRLAYSLPLILIGAGFIVWRRHLQEAE